MLTKQDLKQIDNVVETKLEKFAQDVLLPAFSEIATKEWTKEWCLENLATKFELFRLEAKFEEKISYLIQWMGKNIVEPANTDREKFSALTTILQEQKILTRQH